ncbi:MAG: hypothetical protein CM15mP115_08880 [Alphaproteobacteria bacterium]|nr:MAG: hypothetical protein CM15mP115_08880 [Alphaproteobacteria bacterium]
MRNTDWFNYGGVIVVELFETPQTVTGSISYLDDDGIHVEVAVEGPATQAKLANPGRSRDNPNPDQRPRKTIPQAQPVCGDPKNPGQMSPFKRWR